MSISLAVGVDSFDRGRDSILVYTRLSLFHQDYELFDALKAAAAPLPVAVGWYEDEGLRYRRDDQYGEPLTFLTAHQFLRIWNTRKAARLDDWDESCIAFIRAMRPDRKLVLFWK